MRAASEKRTTNEKNAFKNTLRFDRTCLHVFRLLQLVHFLHCYSYVAQMTDQRNDMDDQ